MSKKLLMWPGFKTKAVTFSWDDGALMDDWVSKTMYSYGLKGTFNLVSSRVMNVSKEEKKKSIYASELKEVYTDRGMEIAVHGNSHKKPNVVPDASAAVYDFVKCRNILEKATGTIIKGAAYAEGTSTDEIDEYLALAGFCYCRTADDFVGGNRSTKVSEKWFRWYPTCHFHDPKLLEVTEKFLATKDDNVAYKLLYVWGHPNEVKKYDAYGFLEDFFKKISGRDNIWYATNMDIYNYVHAYRSLISSADGSMYYNPTLTDIYLCYNGKHYIIPSGKTVVLTRDGSEAW